MEIGLEFGVRVLGHCGRGCGAEGLGGDRDEIGIGENAGFAPAKREEDGGVSLGNRVDVIVDTQGVFP